MYMENFPSPNTAFNLTLGIDLHLIVIGEISFMVNWILPCISKDRPKPCNRSVLRGGKVLYIFGPNSHITSG